MSKVPLHYINGKFVEDKDLVIPVGDLGFIRGYAAFDFLITYNLKPFKLAEHVKRLFSSAESMGLELPWDEKEIEKLVLQTLSKNEDGNEKMIKIIVSGGMGEMVPKGNPTLVITCRKRELYPSEYYENGVDILMVEHTRYMPEAKTNNYIEGVKQTQRAHKVGAFQPIYFDKSQVFEGSNTNIFSLLNGKFVTTKNNILKGITRSVVMGELDLSVEERDFTFEELLSAKEVFLTGSNAEILPATKINGKEVGDGSIGPETKEVMKRFKEYTER